MLKLININHIYKDGKNSLHILKNISINFKSQELVFILGPSGSGKSTLLHILSGLIKPTSGNVYFGNKYLNNLSSDELAKYRNHHFGFIFQNYHLIEYMTVLDNLKLCQNKPNIKKIINLLKDLNISSKINTKVSLLSGGEKERVAIARALLNDPEVIFCDEPTGALDQVTANHIMGILKNIAKNKLVIVVSHDTTLASIYADRIINIKDGQIITPPVLNNSPQIKLTKSKINKLTILKIALKNLFQTKRRTLLTSFAISIGITSISIISFLSLGFNQEITTLEENLVTSFPITIREATYNLPPPKISPSNNTISIKYQKDYYHTNKITNEYLTYLKNNPNYHSQLFHYDIHIPIITDTYHKLSPSSTKAFPSINYLKNNYQLIAGKYPENTYEIVLQIDSSNLITEELATSFQLPSIISYSSILNHSIKILANDEYFLNTNNSFYPNPNLASAYQNSNLSLTIVGIVKEKEIIDDSSYLLYHQDITEYLLNKNQTSQIVNYQLKTTNLLLSDKPTKPELLSYLGYETLPYQIDIYFSSLLSKELYLKYLDNYSQTKVIYEDSMKDTISIVKDFINIISLILIIFSVIAILVSSIMTSILTNTRIMERIKEIGILRSLGATSKNIKLLFNLENLFLAFFSSVIALLISISLSTPLNSIINQYLNIPNMYQINYQVFLLISFINSIITIISGHSSVRKASKLDVISCLRYN